MKAVLATATLFATAICWAEPSMVETAQLRSLAAQAKTPVEHAHVAKQARLHAEAMESKAAIHERSAAQLERSMGPMAHKWPAMAPRALFTEKEAARQARLTARQSRELAENHLRLSVEALVDTQ